MTMRHRRLVRQLAGHDEAKRWQAATELSQVDDPRALRGVRAVLDRNGDEAARAAAVYVLGFAGEEDDVEVLARQLSDRNESPLVRAYAAEALGHLLQHRLVPAEARVAVARSLHDPSPEVRFWSAFAVGVLGLKEARSQLERLTTDDARVEGWWTVGEEAVWALRCLDGEEDPPQPERM